MGVYSFSSQSLYSFFLVKISDISNLLNVVQYSFRTPFSNSNALQINYLGCKESGGGAAGEKKLHLKFYCKQIAVVDHIRASVMRMRAHEKFKSPKYKTLGFDYDK